MWLTAMAGVVIAWWEERTRWIHCCHRVSLEESFACQAAALFQSPVHKNTVLFQSFWGPCRSYHHSSNNIKSALRRKLRSPYRCPSCPAPRRAARAWSTLLASTAAGRQKCSEDAAVVFLNVLQTEEKLRPDCVCVWIIEHNPLEEREKKLIHTIKGLMGRESKRINVLDNLNNPLSWQCSRRGDSPDTGLHELR